MNTYKEHNVKHVRLGPFLIVIAVTEAIALVLGQVAGLSGVAFVVLVLAAAALAAGLAFTIFEVRRLGNGPH